MPKETRTTATPMDQQEERSLLARIAENGPIHKIRQLIKKMGEDNDEPEVSDSEAVSNADRARQMWLDD